LFNQSPVLEQLTRPLLNTLMDCCISWNKPSLSLRELLQENLQAWISWPLFLEHWRVGDSFPISVRVVLILKVVSSVVFCR
jgi:hypothetical protein